MKKKHSIAIIYLIISIVSLLLFITLRVVNDPNKYSWCNEHGWPEGIGNCFNLGIEHFTIDAFSILSLSASIAFIILAFVTYYKEIKKQ